MLSQYDAEGCTKGQPHIIKTLKYGEVIRAADAHAAAFLNNPVHKYVEQTPDLGRCRARLQKRHRLWMMRIRLAIYIRQSRAYTIKHGAAISILSIPASQKLFCPTDRLLGWLQKWLVMSGLWLMTPQQRRRVDECVSKQRANHPGDEESLTKMYHLDLLATDPAHQGEGMGAALVQHLTSIADAEGRATFLTSTDDSNTAFYEACGFDSWGTCEVGKDEGWDGGPILIRVMKREPNTAICI